MHADGSYCTYGETRLGVSDVIVFVAEEISGSNCDGDNDTVIIITVMNA